MLSFVSSEVSWKTSAAFLESRTPAAGKLKVVRPPVADVKLWETGSSILDSSSTFTCLDSGRFIRTSGAFTGLLVIVVSAIVYNISK